MDTAPATVEWLSPEPASQARAALVEWALAHGVRLVEPEALHAPEIRVDPQIADRVEEELDRARAAMSAQEADVAERALARAETSLRAHPELPQAAWLMAEVLRAWAARWLRLEPRDEARAARAWQRAAGLDGGRVPGIGEQGAKAPDAVSADLVVDAGGEVLARLDGAVVSAGTILRAEGEHALVVSQDGSPRFAAWVTIAPNATIRVSVSQAPACSTDDIGRARIAGDKVISEGVRCARWVAAFPAGRTGALRVATCEGAYCGPLVAWRVEPAHTGPWGPTPAESPKKSFPTWASIALFGAGILAASTVAVLVSDAVKKPDPETRFVNGGIKVHHFGF